jgi:hypothetical protein
MTPLFPAFEESMTAAPVPSLKPNATTRPARLVTTDAGELPVAGAVALFDAADVTRQEKFVFGVSPD